MKLSTKRDRLTMPFRKIAPLLTIDDLAELLRVHRRTVYRLCASGEMPRPLKVGGSNRWKAEDILAAIERLQDVSVPGDEERVDIEP